MSRNTLHIKKIDQLKDWLKQKEIPFRNGKGEYQILQICFDGKQWAGIYKRDFAKEHLTNDRRLDSLIKRFCRES